MEKFSIFEEAEKAAIEQSKKQNFYAEIVTTKLTNKFYYIVYAYPILFNELMPVVASYSRGERFFFDEQNKINQDANL